MQIERRSLLSAAAIALVAGGARGAQAKESFNPNARLGRTPHTRFAVNVEMWWSGLPFLDRLPEAAKLGFPAIEFWDWRSKDIDAIAETCRKLDLAVAQFTAWGFEPGLNDPRNHDAFVRAVEEACAVAKKLGARAMTVVGGNDQPDMTQAQMHAHIVTGLKRAAPIAEAHDVLLILEPMNIRVDHKGHCLYGSAPAIEIVRAVGSKHVKINWDLYHLQVTEGDLCGHLREGIREIGYVQLADVPGRHEPGTGEVRYTRVLQELQALGYGGWVGLECTPSKNEIAAARAVARVDAW